MIDSMEIRHLKTFAAVARFLSFQKAAEHLHYAQSSVSAQIQALEDELDVKLFDRLGRRIVLTEAGDRLRPYAQKLIELASETEAAFKTDARLEGGLTIRVPESVAVHHLPPVLKEFCGRHPRVQLKMITCAREGLDKDLRSGITDLAFLLDESIQAADLEVAMLLSEPLVLVARPDHPLVAAGKVATAQLSGQTLLVSRVDCSYRRLVEAQLRADGVEMQTYLELNSITAIKACVQQDLGLTVLPRIAVAEEIRQGTLSPVAWHEGPKEAALLMIWYRQRWLSPILRAFMDTVRQVLKPAV
jgi:DNA-binding transcriptional LysR family regulator